MCRLFASTDIAIPVQMRRLFFNQLGVLAQADGNHNDGAGVTDGNIIRKSAYPWSVMGPRLLNDLDSEKLWIGHVRKKSSGTDYSPFAAHPFMFKYGEKGDKFLYAAHNGTIYGYENIDSRVNVDSYKAFEVLARMLEKGGSIDAKTINDWTASFEYGSEWTFMFTEDGQTLKIAVGHRDMFALTFGAGMLFCTSDIALDGTAAWASYFWQRAYHFGRDIKKVSKFTLVTANLGKNTYSTTPLASNPVAPPSYMGYQVVSDRENETILKI